MLRCLSASLPLYLPISLSHFSCTDKSWALITRLNSKLDRRAILRLQSHHSSSNGSAIVYRQLWMESPREFYGAEWRNGASGGRGTIRLAGQVNVMSVGAWKASTSQLAQLGQHQHQHQQHFAYIYVLSACSKSASSPVPTFILIFSLMASVCLCVCVQAGKSDANLSRHVRIKPAYRNSVHSRACLSV